MTTACSDHDAAFVDYGGVGIEFDDGDGGVPARRARYGNRWNCFSTSIARGRAIDRAMSYDGY